MKTVNNCGEVNDVFVLKGPVDEISIPEKDPFKNDKLGRKDYIIKLTDVVLSCQDGIVFALNGAWGSGKTTFVKMWKQYLMNQGVPVAYYNAWIDDISDEPLYSLLKQLNEVVGKNDKRRKKVFITGAKLLSRMGLGALKGFLGPLGKILVNMGEGVSKEMSDLIKEVVKNAGEEGADGIQDIIEKSLEEENDTASLMKEFRKVFQEYVRRDKSNKKATVPLVYFVDELDRCSPSFAVKVLERIKHLFEVKNVVFVLSIDKQQLAHSINGYYGSDLFDSMEYLRRFIGIEYYLPEPDFEDYFVYLYVHYGFDKLSISLIGSNNAEYDDYLALFKLLIKNEGLSIRQIERVFMLVRFYFNNERLDNRQCHYLMGYAQNFSISFILAYLKVSHPDIYINIRKLKYTVEELAIEIEKLKPFKEYYKADTDSFKVKLFSMNMILLLLNYSLDYHIYILKINPPKLEDSFDDVAEISNNFIDLDILHEIRNDECAKVLPGLLFRMNKMDMFDIRSNPRL